MKSLQVTEVISQEAIFPPGTENTNVMSLVC